MDSPIVFLHSWLRWLVLAAAAFAVIQWLRPSNPKLERISRAALVGLVDLEVTLGLVRWVQLYLPWGKIPFGELMRDAAGRFFAVEHPSLMLASLVVLHVGSVRARRAADEAQGRRRWGTALVVALVLVLVSIPWPFRTALGRGWVMPWPG